MTNSVSSTPESRYSLASFFAGVGGIELGFEQTGKFRIDYANEFDKNAAITYKTNFPEVELDERDIHDVLPSEVPNSDIFTGGFPCQAFSIAGYRKGFEDERGDLFFELLRIINHKKPQAIFIENVKNMVTHDHGNTFKVIREALVTNGYFIKWKVLNTKDYGNIPQNRERIYIVGFNNKAQYDSFEFPGEVTLTTKLHDILNYEDKFDEAYYYREGKQPFYSTLAEGVTNEDSVYQWRRQYVRENKSGVVPTLTANMGTGGHNVPIILTKGGIRKLTPRETFNVQGFPEEFNLPKDMAKSHLYKQSGNSVSVPVIKRIATNIAKALDIKVNRKKIENKKLTRSNFALIFTSIHGRYSGYSELVETFDTIKEAELFKDSQSKNINILSDDEYIHLIKKGKSQQFYMIVPL
ncbi:DNA cytosine methyltransferase [Aerococcus urinae]|uniref:Cytosine-specific methyltransferase n=1 Tax=Aerococcus urinae TaxID=1376 RepID=A0A0X8FFP6_9LACT|nr:DNA cytosine methyltransferase [Aerococcus urinae]AMB96485.1 DNA cytosine methyltransferase [Aerococcus urinae]MCY3032141.1 DNA cytosine methyltransferase [Aerococcus urinae]MCY3037647.1 DNA cytosine methyltransferase [Aerococcus urinae]MCY3044187.1 DNA cytosine methyltransferase [Aerococcus urinae]MCY3045687.1 DNA cytosine methyltransferase [Aerococcus urinae]